MSPSGAGASSLPRRLRRRARRIFGGGPAAGASAVGATAAPASPKAGVRLLIGPLNASGQATRWARLVEQHVADAKAQSFAKGKSAHPVDLSVPASIYRRNRRWQRDFEQTVTRDYSHVLIEGAQPVFGGLYGSDASYDLPALLKAGLNVALIAHGPDVRVPSRHADLEMWSPFPHLDGETVEVLERDARRAVELLTSFPGHVYVATPDLLDFVPQAVWCPVVVDVARLRSDSKILQGDRPVVVSVPGDSAATGADLIAPLLERLEQEGLIEHRRVPGSDSADQQAAYREADIVLDGFRLGSYGVAACEAMAAGRVVVGHVADSVRHRVLEQTGLHLPVVEASADTLERVLRDLVADPEVARTAAAAGLRFVEEVHDGRRSAAALEPFLRGANPVSADWRPGWLRPKVVMLAGNDIVTDARVLKYAHTVAKWDIDVTALGLAGRRLRGSTQLGEVVVHCPVITSRALVTGWRKRLGALRPWISDDAEYSRASARIEYGSRELRADRGRDRRDAERAAERATAAGATNGTAVGFGERVRRAIRWRTLKLKRRTLELRALPVRRVRATADDLGFGPARNRKIKLYRSIPAGRWRRVMPEVIDQELAIGPLLDQIQPDLIHVHDVFMLGIGARAAHRAALDGRTVKLVYDAHEYIPGVPVVTPRRIAAYCDLENEFLADADRVVTVSQPLAEWLRRDHQLERTPDVVLNAPVDVPDKADVEGLREVVGLADDVPLLVYNGGVNRARGVHTVVDALTHLPGVHLAIVARINPVTDELQRHAIEIGVGDRVHFAPFVDPELVPLYLASATVGISPLLHAPNHDVALTNKFCEYIAAGLPIITSDTPAQAEFVDQLGLGAVYRAGDVDALVQAIRQVLARRDQLAQRIREDAELRHRFSWAAQAEVVREVYAELLGGLPEAAWLEGATSVTHLTADPDQS